MSALHRVTFFTAVAACAAIAVAAGAARAQESFPSKPIRFIVPFTAGGGNVHWASTQ